MQAIYFDGTEVRHLSDYPQPEPEQGEALIKILYAGICNTDLEIVQGYKEFSGILGHEFVGIVEKCEDATLIGRRVVGEINVSCGTCSHCCKGLKTHCLSLKVLGIMGIDGVFADFITLPVANLHTVPDKISDLEAVFAAPLAAAAEILNQCHIKPEDSIAVLGDGKLGQLITQVLSLTGCRLTVIGKHEERLSLLSDKAETVLYPASELSRDFDMVVECTGNATGLDLARTLVRPRGKVVLKSTFSSQAATFEAGWVVDELTLIGSRCGPIDAALRLMERGLVNLEPLIGGIYKLAACKEAFAAAMGRKVLFDLR